MPDYPSTSKRFLNEEESIIACTRLAVDGIGLTQGRGAAHIPHWVAFKMTCADWRVWAQCFMFVLVTGSQTMQYFIPTLVNSFGWTGPVGQCKSAQPIWSTFLPRITNQYFKIIPSLRTWLLSSMSLHAAG